MEGWPLSHCNACQREPVHPRYRHLQTRRRRSCLLGLQPTGLHGNKYLNGRRDPLPAARNRTEPRRLSAAPRTLRKAPPPHPLPRWERRKIAAIQAEFHRSFVGALYRRKSLASTSHVRMFQRQESLQSLLPQRDSQPDGRWLPSDGVTQFCAYV